MNPFDAIRPYFAAIKFGLAIAVVAAAAIGGWSARGWKEDSSRLDAERQAHEYDVAQQQSWAAAVQQISGELEQGRQRSAADRRQWEKELNDAKRNGSLVVCGPGLRGSGNGAEGGVAGRLSGDFVRLWNGALGVGLPATLGPWRVDGAGYQADPSAVIDPEDALDNLEVNAEQCNDLRGKLIGWQAWARSIGAAK